MRRTLESHRVPDEKIEVVELLTSELVTNAIVHACSAPDIEVAASETRVQVAVTDGTPDAPRVQPEDGTALQGRGLRLVDRLAALWGTEHLPGGRKRIWFEVRLDR